MASFRKRNGKWYYKTALTIEGKKTIIERVGGRTKKEAVAALNKLMVEMENTGTIGDKTPLFEHFAKTFLDEQVEPFVKPNTYARYESALRNHLIPQFQGIHLKDITAPMIQKYVTSCKATMARASLTNNLVVLHKMLKSATGMYGYLKHNPCDAVTLPRYDDGKEEAHTYSDEQMQAIFKMYPEGHRLYLPVMLGYHAGLRIGEALALSWGDVDLQRSILHIHSTIDKYDKVQSTPKTDSSNRDIAIGNTLKVALNKARLKQVSDKLALGDKYWTESGRVCINPDGKPITLNNMRAFNRFTNKTFGNGYSFHTLRHTHISLLLDAGADLDYVSKRAGHSNIGITSKTYSHVLEKRQAKGVDLINSVM